MSISETVQALRPSLRHVCLLLAAAVAVLTVWQPHFALETAVFVVSGLVSVMPIVIPGILLAGWIMASGASGRTADAFHERTLLAVVAATLVGAILPVCGITVLPLMVGLLAGGVPLAPVMAFWLASPITDPAMLAATVAMLGWEFALGKVAAAIGLGLFGGGMTMLFAARPWARGPLRDNRIVGRLGAGCGDNGFRAAIWRDPTRRDRFWREIWSVSRLIIIVLIPAFAAEFLLNAWLQPGVVAAYVGGQSIWAIPLAVIVGGPAYIDGYAALPLTRALLEQGMSPGAGMAFLVAGGVVSIWGALAIFPVLRLKPFLLYLGLAVTGSMASGWIFDALM